MSQQEPLSPGGDCRQESGCPRRRCDQDEAAVSRGDSQDTTGTCVGRRRWPSRLELGQQHLWASFEEIVDGQSNTHCLPAEEVWAGEVVGA